MMPGIDPKVDIAFKKVFGSEETRSLTVALINAVLAPTPWHRLVDIELLNPFTQQMTLNDKLSILDIRARDDQGRVFNVEMQMVARAALPQRFLYYWARLYSEQLFQGDAYDQLCPTILLCFVNGRLFQDESRYHRRFRLLDPDGPVVLTDQQEIHVLELPNFARSLDELHEPLDFWMYFLNNGEDLDADLLPGPLDRDEVRRAMEVLKMLSQNQLERELYEGRLKAKRDALTQERLLSQALEREAEFRERIAESERRRAESEQQLAAAIQRRAEEVQEAVRPLLVRQIQLYERVLGRDVTDAADLERQDLQTLRAVADRLERQVTPPH